MNILESIMDALKFAYRQKAAVYRAGEVLTSIFAGGFHPKRIIAFIIGFLTLCASRQHSDKSKFVVGVTFICFAALCSSFSGYRHFLSVSTEKVPLWGAVCEAD